MRYGRLLPAIFLGIVLAVYAQEPTSVSTSTVKTGKRRHTAGQHLKKISDKVLTPNPKFQGPQSQSMPTPAPKSPKLTQPPTPPSPTRSERFFSKVASIMTTSWDDNIFVWLPAFSTDPNTGPTYGILPVLVLSDPAKHHIRHLVAPSYTYNSLFRQTITARYYYYPTDASQLYATASYSQRVNRELKIRYEDAELMGGRMFLRAEGFYDVDGSQRFFGIGPNTRDTDEAGYTGQDRVYRLDMGVNFFKSMRLSAGVRYRHLGVSENIIPNVTDLSTKFAGAAATAGQDVMVQGVHVLWDSRDLPVTPSKGRTGEMFFEKTSHGWGSDADYIRYGIDGRRFIPWKGGKQITALHLLFDQTNGPNIPFYEMATLGGRETLRGFGDGRFTDRGRILLNFEQRIELTSIALMGVVTRFEVGPFVDVGTVFPRAPDMQWKTLQPVYGGSFRAAVKPNVVGSVDVGVGREGVGTYVGINYPF